MRTHDRQKLLNILDQCSADSCPAELQPDLQQMAWRYFYNRGEATIEEYKRFGEPGLEILSWRFGTIDDNQIVSKLTTLHAAGQFKIWDWSHTTRSTAQILMSGPNVELEPCRAPADERDPFTLRSDELVSRSAPRL